MIRNIFLPEKYGTYYLFSKNIVGIDMGKTTINAVILCLKGHTVTIKKCLEEQIITNSSFSYNDRVTKSLTSLFNQIEDYDTVNLALSSSFVIFKELKLPFLSHEKISMVIHFEVEPLLPFPIQDMIIDFIVTKRIQEEKTSEILVAAVQKSTIKQHLDMFEQAGIPVDTIVVDLFALYGLYNAIPQYRSLQGVISLVDFGLHTTKISYIYNKQLRFIRTLNSGVSSLAKTVGDTLSIKPNEAMEHIVRFGLEKPDWPEYMKVLTDALIGLWSNINFTLTSFTSQIIKEKNINKLLLLGRGGTIKGLQPFITKILHTNVELFDPTNITQNRSIILQDNYALSHSCTTSLSTAFPSPVVERFNFRRDEFTKENHALFMKQLLSATILSFTIITLLVVHYIMQVKKLQQEAYISQQEIVTTLRKQLTIPKEETDIEDIIMAAQKEVTKEEETWFAFSSRARTSFLQYLLELTNNIDKEGLGFSINKLTIAEGMITLTAQVLDHEALKLLERELRQSKLFRYVEPQDDPRFTMKIILAPTTEET